MRTLSILAILLLTHQMGCSHETTIRVVDRETGKPLVGAPIERWEKKSFLNRVWIPTYSHQHVETVTTDATGAARFESVEYSDTFDVHFDLQQPHRSCSTRYSWGRLKYTLRNWHGPREDIHTAARVDGVNVIELDFKDLGISSPDP